MQEGRSATVVVQQKAGSYYYYLCIDGKIEASNNTPDLRCERLLGHVAALLHPAPRKTLTVGLGTGTTAGCFVLYPEIEKITICEIEPVVRDAAGRYFAKENNRRRSMIRERRSTSTMPATSWPRRTRSST